MRRTRVGDHRKLVTYGSELMPDCKLTMKIGLYTQPDDLIRPKNPQGENGTGT